MSPRWSSFPIGRLLSRGGLAVFALGVVSLSPRESPPFQYDWPECLVLLGACAATLGFLIGFHRSKHPMGACPRCGYDLRASSGPRCPECGDYFERSECDE